MIKIIKEAFTLIGATFTVGSTAINTTKIENYLACHDHKNEDTTTTYSYKVNRRVVGYKKCV